MDLPPGGAAESGCTCVSTADPAFTTACSGGGDGGLSLLETKPRQATSLTEASASLWPGGAAGEQAD